MKAQFSSNFEYGRKMARFFLAAAVLLDVCALLLLPDKSIQQIVGVLCSFACLVTAVVMAYRYCRCPYCGKRIVLGVLAAKSCPSCRRNLLTGKKVKK